MVEHEDSFHRDDIEGEVSQIGSVAAATPAIGGLSHYRSDVERQIDLGKAEQNNRQTAADEAHVYLHVWNAKRLTLGRSPTPADFAPEERYA